MERFERATVPKPYRMLGGTVAGSPRPWPVPGLSLSAILTAMVTYAMACLYRQGHRRFFDGPVAKTGPSPMRGWPVWTDRAIVDLGMARPHGRAIVKLLVLPNKGGLSPIL